MDPSSNLKAHPLPQALGLEVSQLQRAKIYSLKEKLIDACLDWFLAAGDAGQLETGGGAHCGVRLLHPGPRCPSAQGGEPRSTPRRQEQPGS